MKFFNVKQLLVVAITIGSIASISALDIATVVNHAAQTYKDATAIKTDRKKYCLATVGDIDMDIKDIKKLGTTFGLGSYTDSLPTINEIKAHISSLGIEPTYDQIFDYLWVFIKGIVAKIESKKDKPFFSTIYKALTLTQNKIGQCSGLATNLNALDALFADEETAE